MAPRDAWLTTSDVADDLGVSGETVRRYIRTGRLRASAFVGASSGRTTYRIARAAFTDFRTAYVKDTGRDDWER
jgi:excisionase family DNA binding protein